MPAPTELLLVFHTVNLSLKAEKVLRAAGVLFQVTALPKEITSGCSIVIGIGNENLAEARDALDEANLPIGAVYSRLGKKWELFSGERQPERDNCFIYLDNNATTRPHPDVVRAVASWLSEEVGNPSSVHAVGRKTRKAVEAARDAVARLVGSDSSEIVFTSGGTESNNIALLGIAASRGAEGRHIMTLKTEHSSILEPCRRLEASGTKVTYLPVDSNGLVDLDDLRRAIEPGTVLISVAWANNETGVIQPIREIARIARQNSVLFHSDAVQAAGKIPLNVKDDGIDLLSISAHKFHGLMGAGTLYVRKGVAVHPILHGGGQEAALRSGTENVPGIIAMGVAATVVLAEPEETSRRLRKLRDILYEDLKEKIPWAKINGHPSRRLPNTLNLCFQDISGDEIAAFLDKEGICVSTGSACAAGEPEPSHVLLAMGLTEEQARSSIRFSLSRETTAEEIQRTVQAVARIVRRYR